MRSKLNPLKLVRDRVLTDSVATQIGEGWGRLDTVWNSTRC